MSDKKKGEASFVARVTDGHRVTVPVEVREKLGIKLGDLIDVEIRKEVEGEG